MRLVFITFSLFCSLAWGEEFNWQRPVETLISGEGDTIAARKALSGHAELDVKLTKALEKGGVDEQLALSAIRLLPRPSMVDYLLTKLNQMDIRDNKTQAYFVTLASMSGGTYGDKILKELARKVDVTSSQVSPAIRIALLSGMSLKQTAPSADVLQKLLDDSSFELRMKAMEVSEFGIAQNPAAHKEFLMKGLIVGPYPVRLKAADAIARLPIDLRRQFKEAVGTCKKSDQNSVVKKACSEVKF